MPIVATIGGVDYSAYFKGVTLTPGGDGQVGSATLTFDAVAGGLTIVPMQDVKVWQTFNGAGAGIANKGRLFGGHINSRTTSNFGNTKTWQLNCWDYNVVLDKLVRDIWWAGSAKPIVLTAGHFNAQILSLFDQLQKNGGAAPPVMLDVSTGVVDFTPSMPAVTYPGGHKASWYVQQLCNAAQVLVPAIRPHFYLGTGNTFGVLDTFGTPVLWVYDGASTPSAVVDFSDTPVGAQKPYYGTFKRVDDSTVLTQRIQSDFKGSTITSYDPTSQGTYPNNYINHGGTGNTGYWMDEAKKDQGSATNAEAQASLDRFIAAKANPKETFTFETTERVMPGEYVTITNALEGLTAQKYRVAQVRMTIEPPETIVSQLTIGNRRLLLFDNGEEEVAGVPIEGDHIPPLAPTAFSVTSNTWNRNTNQADMVFAIGASPSPDTAGYYIVGIVGGQEVAHDVLANLTPSMSFGRGLAYSLQVYAYDRNFNDSPDYPASPITGTTAAPAPAPPTALALDTTYGINGYSYLANGTAKARFTFTPPAILPDTYYVQIYQGTGILFDAFDIPGTSTGFGTHDLAIGDTYNYRVYSRDGVLSSTYASLGPLTVPALGNTALVNPSFDEADAGVTGGIRGWDINTANGGTVTQDGANAHAGFYAAKMLTTATIGSNASIRSTHVLIAGQSYSFKFWGKGSTTNSVSWNVTWYANDGVTSLGASNGTQALTTSYAQYSFVAVVAAGAGYFRVQFASQTLSRTVWIDDVSISAQVIANDISAGAVTAGAIGPGAVLPGNSNNGVPYLENPSLEIPNIAGTMPAGWDYNNSGTLVYNQAGTGAGLDGKCSIVLGGGVGTHRFQGPKVPWAYGRRIGIDLSFWYILSTLTGTTVTFGLAQYDRTGAYISDAVAVDPAGGTLSWAAGTATFQRGFKSQSALSLTAAYIAPYVQLVVSSGVGTIELDNFRLDEQGQTIYPTRVQGGSSTGGDTGPYVDLSGTTADAISTAGVKLGSTGSSPILKVLTATATLDFPSTLTRVAADLTITLTGAAVGDAVWLGVPNGSVTTDAVFSAWVSATNTVTVRFYNGNSGTQNPASGTFRVAVVQF